MLNVDSLLRKHKSRFALLACVLFSILRLFSLFARNFFPATKCVNRAYTEGKYNSWLFIYIWVQRDTDEKAGKGA